MSSRDFDHFSTDKKRNIDRVHTQLEILEKFGISKVSLQDLEKS
jgi:hypothetical protein